VHYEPRHYPPLALQAHIGGTVSLHVVVDNSGAVAKVAPLSGHALLAAALKDNISSWKFEPLNEGETEFDLTYKFVIVDKPAPKFGPQIAFPSSGHMLVVAAPPAIEPAYSMRLVTH
jgi:TonB family protein